MKCRFWMGALIGMSWAATAGCVSCGHQQYAKVWQRGADVAGPLSCRQQVYVFLIDGLAPACIASLERLREPLANHGFAKVGVANAVAGVSIAEEIRGIHATAPETKFVLIGYDVGGMVAQLLARELLREGIPIEAVVLVNPVHDRPPCGVRTVLITNGKAPACMAANDRIVVPEANHFRLPTHPTTVRAIVNLLEDLAASCMAPPVDPVPQWSYPHAPAMRPMIPPQGGAWDFLADTGMVPRPIGLRLSPESRLPTDRTEMTQTPITPQ
ncbi:MAG: hypothetical protein NZS48_16575 [Gemmata sp.]|nr:hypothetical protein [Gemmata sp.]